MLILVLVLVLVLLVLVLVLVLSMLVSELEAHLRSDNRAKLRSGYDGKGYLPCYISVVDLF